MDSSSYKSPSFIAGFNAGITNRPQQSVMGNPAATEEYTKGFMMGAKLNPQTIPGTHPEFANGFVKGREHAMKGLESSHESENPQYKSGYDFGYGKIVLTDDQIQAAIQAANRGDVVDPNNYSQVVITKEQYDDLQKKGDGEYDPFGGGKKRRKSKRRKSKKSKKAKRSRKQKK